MLTKAPKTRQLEARSESTRPSGLGATPSATGRGTISRCTLTRARFMLLVLRSYDATVQQYQYSSISTAVSRSHVRTQRKTRELYLRRCPSRSSGLGLKISCRRRSRRASATTGRRGRPRRRGRIAPAAPASCRYP